MTSRARITAAGIVVALTLAGCAATTEAPTPLPPVPSETGDPASGPVQPVGDPVAVATGLAAPWSMVAVPGADGEAAASGSVLISERDTARIVERTGDGELREAGVVDGVVPGGEGGLLGLAIDPADPDYLYAYFTAADDNRIVRMPLEGDPGALELGAAEVVHSGLAKARTHNGGRIAFGPDGMLYATVGDAGQPDRAQDPDSENGKILRMTSAGEVPDDNPFAGSLVYSLGHRNPQGIAWDADGQLWAAEFGQNTWDELNIITAGQNYGWPEVEGIGEVEGFVDPVQQYSTSEASPSGLAFVRDTFFMAGLRGARVFAIYPEGEATPIESVPWFQGQFGRIRDVAAGPDGTLWMLTNNTDGRGDPRQDDDRIIEVRLAPPEEG